jgi:predicted hydrolase (HD superfamily)
MKKVKNTIKKKIFLFVLIFILTVFIYLNRDIDSDEEYLSLEGLLKKYNYPYEKYKFFTDSGYLVGFTRL